MSAAAKLDLALRLLDEIDTTPLSEINAKLDRVTEAVVAAKVAVIQHTATRTIQHREG